MAKKLRDDYCFGDLIISTVYPISNQFAILVLLNTKINQIVWKCFHSHQ